ncbi:MAG: acetyltransferase [Bacteroidales bacterium]|nr:acetyltransferase [Bacteroidales bacterium]
MKKLYLYGASGHGKVVKDILDAQGRPLEGFIDDNPQVDSICDMKVEHQAHNADEIIISVGNNEIRRRIAERTTCDIETAAIHPNTCIAATASIGDGTVVMAGAVVNADAKIGKHCIINTGATVDHECQIGDYVHIAPGVHLCGQVQVGEGTLVGVGSSVIPCVNIGRWCVIGAGSVVLNDVPDGSVAYGNPCRVVKQRASALNGGG